MWTRKRLLVWGTTYPQFSRTYYETVCTGALDPETGKLMRIYPITLRYMQEPFGAYQWIEADVERNTSDFRPESFRIRQDTIRLGEKLGPERWPDRKKFIVNESNVFRSLEALVEAEARDHTSIGLIKPKEILRISVSMKSKAEAQEWERKREEAVVQQDLFVAVPDAKAKDLQFMPITYKVSFTCSDPACSSVHTLSVLDWGTYVLHRKLYKRGGATVAAKKVTSKLEEVTNLQTKDLYLFLGNTKQHSASFSIAGFFYPPLTPPSKQLGLLGID